MRQRSSEPSELARFRKAIPVEILDETELALIASATVETGTPYDLGDIEDAEQVPLAGFVGT